MNRPLVTDLQEWSFDLIEDVYEEIRKVAEDEYNMDVYPNQIEVISSEQMLDAYAAIGLPIMYTHWSFGKSFTKQMEMYKRGYMGLAYEIVINSNPCIAYLMEENSLLMQTLVMAHACFGHNMFFKNNYLFRQWTDAEGIIDYLAFAKQYIMECEEKYGYEAVEEILDSCHALQYFGIDKYKRPRKLSAAEEEARRKEREEYIQSQLNDIWRTIPKKEKKTRVKDQEHFPSEPQENILYFIEKNAPKLEDWEREIVRIVRKISQYFYPQMQTQVMNEGCATFFHYKIVHRLYEKGIIDDGALLEFYETHTNVVFQPTFDHPGFSGINPYALGFNMMRDIERVAMDPTDEDREWFNNQEWVGSGDWLGTIKWAVNNFKDESFIQQFLSPKIIRDFRLFSIHDHEEDPMLEVSGIHNKQGYKRVRDDLARQYNIGYKLPDIQVYNVDRWGDRSMKLKHHMVNEMPLKEDETMETLKHLSRLWGYDVSIASVDSVGNEKSVYALDGDRSLIDIFVD